ALFEVFSFTSEVPLFGALRSGPVAMIYHLLFTACFLFMGIGLITGRKWGYALLFWGTVFYTCDRLLFVWDGAAREAYVLKQFSSYREVLDMIDTQLLNQILILIALISIACWWGFVLFVRLRRDYFQPSQTG
ncbi:MAG: hypothetical protein KJ645_00910, partial [Planctomycetes bacterium]|nr:hypothetical protein [Planctomycetota bacterium]